MEKDLFILIIISDLMIGDGGIWVDYNDQVASFNQIPSQLFFQLSP